MRLDRLGRSGDRAGARPTARRGVLVRLTEQGERIADQALEGVLAADEAFLEPLDRRQRQAASSLLRRLLVRCEQG